MDTSTQAPSGHEVDVIVVGAGFAGLRALHSLRSSGKRVAVLEAGTGIGGVWFWNRYPGARCDIESYDYSYGFDPDLEQEWRWTQRYAQQPEILSYIEHVADRFDLRRDVHLEQRVTHANWDAEGRGWEVVTEAGDRWRGRYLLWAVGNLSATKRPPLPGTEDFTGRIVHTAEWPHEGVDVAGLRVGVVGTGSSGMQSIPILAKEAAHLTVFQRTPNFSVPARHHAISDREDAHVKAGYRERRRRVLESPTGLGFRPRKESALEVPESERTAAFEQAWDGAGFGFALTYRDLLLDIEANATAAEFIRGKIAATVKDPAVRELLTPNGYPFGAKRPVVDDGYFETFNRDNVTLVDIRTDGLARVTSEGVETDSGEVFPLDVLVFATGFDAMTGSLLRPDIVGRDGMTLREKWRNGPVTHLGLGTHDFPNMFIIAGPGSPALLINVLVGIELHVDWIVDLLAEADRRGTEVIEVEHEAEQAWGVHLEQRAQETLYPKARSYYMGDEIPGKPRVFMLYSGGLRNYRRLLTECTAANYRGFELTKD